MRHLTILVAMAWIASPVAAQTKRPNVLILCADDLNCNLGCYGHGVVKSPNVDRLARMGVRFERAYCNYPVCNPSRTSFLSGRRPETSGIVDNVTPPRTVLGDAVMLPEYFRRLGYFVVKVGKIYHTGKEFEDARSWDADIRETSDAKKPPEAMIAGRPAFGSIILKAKDEETYDGRLARKSVEYLEKAAKGDRPFFLAVGFRRPHAPYIATEKYYSMYPAEKMPIPEESAEHLKAIPPVAFLNKIPDPTPERIRAARAAYWASITYMDAQLGLILDAMDRLNLWDNTVVLFISDHGYHLGEHGGLWHKMSLFEESVRVPLIVITPGKKGNVPCSRLVELVDLYPSVCELCRVEAPQGLEGKSFVPLLADPARSWRSAAYTVVARSPSFNKTSLKIENADLGRSIRTERYRFTVWHDGSLQLYDHDQDPHEFRNLATNEDQAKLIAQMREKMAAIRAK